MTKSSKLVLQRLSCSPRIALWLGLAFGVFSDDVTGQNEAHGNVARIPDGDYWFEVDLCLDVPIKGRRCGWKAALNSSRPIRDLVVFPSSIRLRHGRGSIDGDDAGIITDESSGGGTEDIGSGWDTANGVEDIGSGWDTGNGAEGTGSGSDTGNGAEDDNGQGPGNGQNPRNKEDVTTTKTSSQSTNTIIGNFDYFVMESMLKDTCITLIALKDDTWAVDLHAAIRCVCLWVNS